MKIVSIIYKKAVLAVVLALGTLMSSCTDYLTIIPADKVVEENFWITKDQVNGMLATSYLKLLSRDAVERAIIWGEMRSDNMTYHPTYNSEIKNIVEANITDENSFSRWGIFYEAINYANLVLESADKAMEHDPDFTPSDLKIVKGEMYAMRALCHFYLVRAFRDIPLALHSAKNDSEIPEYVQVPPLEALDKIMEDLDRAESMVMKSGTYSTAAQNCGRITRNAVLAIKADVNLWRAAFAAYYDKADVDTYYNQCIENCDAVIASMDEILGNEKYQNDVKTLIKPYNLIPNFVNKKDIDDATKKLEQEATAPASAVYNAIFGSKNSLESIFELQVDGANIDNNSFNGAYSVYGSEGSTAYAIVPVGFVKGNYEKDDVRAYSYTDTKPQEYNDANVKEDNTYIVKYAAKGSPATAPATANFRKSNSWDANWILYRRTDVLLMKAEAMVTRSTAGPDDFHEAFKIVKAINYRSRIDTSSVYSPLREEKYMTQSAVIDLVRKERLLELSYEGKRWFDLVRLALREKDTKNILFVTKKLGSSLAGTVEKKMKKIDGLFMPIHITELRYNKNLKQNPAYDEDDSSMEMN